MPTNYRLQIQKSIQYENWSNDYLITEETVEDAEDVANDLITFERHLHMSIVNFDYVRISTTLVGDRYFRHLPLNVSGMANTVEYMPLFNVLRMDMDTSISDPGRKYYRLPLGEGTQTNGALLSDSVTAWQGIINTFLIANSLIQHIWTPKGHQCIGAKVYPYVQMRQLNRRAKKKVLS